MVVIGAGPAGLTAAYELARRGFRVEVFEAGEAVGGMARSLDLWGQRVDLGPHRFFSRDARVNRFWREALDGEYSLVRRLTRIYYRKRFFDYPLSAANALGGLGPWEAGRCLLSYFRAKVAPRENEDSFEDWVANRFGARLYSIFFQSYSEKLWGIPCKDLDADFAAQRIRKLSLFEAVRAAVFRDGGARHKTLAGEFAYPHQGAGAVYERLADKVRSLGGSIHVQSAVAGVSLPGEGAGLPRVRLENGAEVRCGHVVSSMPLPLLVERMGAPAAVREQASRLRFRNTILVYLLVEGANPFPDQWIYVHAPELRTGRITNFRNWVPSIRRGQAGTILCLEYWCNGGEALWSCAEEELVRLATQEIHATGLAGAVRVREGRVVRLPRCYPVYEKGYRRHLAPVEEYLSTQRGLTAVGRYGSFKYNNQDHSILMGMLAAENIAEGAGHDLWALNSSDEYQESSPS